MRSPRDGLESGARGITGLQAESWRLLWDEMASDETAKAERREWVDRRRVARPRMLALLRRFLGERLTLEAFRSTLDRRARTTWDVFGLRGMSGAMFLNRLTKHVADDELASRLRAVLSAPHSIEDARERLASFVAFLDAESARAGSDGRVLQPAHAAFFVSVWWHLQDPEPWPAFHLTARRALQVEEELFVPTGDIVGDYLAFRAAFLAVQRALGVDPWELEFLCWWQQHRAMPHDAWARRGARPPARPRARSRRAPAARAAVVVPGPIAVRERALELPVTREETTPTTRVAATQEHTRAQWLLARIGRALGCRVWIAANDRRRRWMGEPLDDLTVPRLPPLGLDPAAQRIVSLIDVVWLRGTNQIAAAFEIERTTSIHSGLLRMSDLAALSPNLSFPLYIVAPEERREKVLRELRRPTFQLLELQHRCAFVSNEALLESADAIMRWGHGPESIARLASRGDEEGTGRSFA